MRIGIDGGCWGNRRGYGRFLRELLTALVKVDRENEYSILLDSQSWESFPLKDSMNAIRVGTSESVGDGASADRRRSAADLLRMSFAAARNRSDIFFFPSVYSYFPLIRPVPMLLGIHDTMADRHPEFAFASNRERRFWNWKVRLALAQGDTILTVSQHSSRSIEEQFHWPLSKIRVIGEAAAPHFKPTIPPNTDAPYILYVGGISPNKNLGLLIGAFGRIHKSIPGWKLLLAGDFEGDGFKTCYHELKAQIHLLGLDEEIIFPGYVAEEAMCDLYSGASLFAFPSLDEGFGLPVLEAMACGAPVIAARGHALDEVVGDAGILIDPQGEEELADAMKKVLTDSSLRADLRGRSIQRAAEFTWTRAAEQLLTCFHEMSGTGR